MKKLLLSCAALCASLSASATDYNGTLLVNVDGLNAEPAQSKIIVNKQADGKYELLLNDFTLNLGGEVMYVGSIHIKDVEADTEDGNPQLSCTQNIKIENGTYDEVNGEPVFWLGPILSADGGIDVTLDAELIEDGRFLDAGISIFFSGMNILVEFDSQNYQLPNASFDAWHNLTNGFGEPDYFHSTATADGILSAAGQLQCQVEPSSPRAGATDPSASSLRITSALVSGKSVNGVITNGRISMNSADPADASNHSSLDLAKSDVKDESGFPFATCFAGVPDSLEMWVDYHVGARDNSNSANVYASVSAVLTDGSYYQNPEDKKYKNVVARAEAQIADTKGEWTRVCIPFDYTEGMANQVDPRALLFVASTCSVAGGGSNDASDPDVLLIDDLRFTYSSEIASVEINGVRVPNFKSGVLDYQVGLNAMPTEDDIEVEGVNPGLRYAVNFDEDEKIIYITAVSQDLLSSTQYVLHVVDPALAINGTSAANLSGVKTVYNVSGQPVDASSLQKGQVYIEKYDDGKTVKRIR